MTLIGKILTMMIAVMSIVFLAFTMMTYTTHKNWREAANTANSQLENSKKLLQENQAVIEEFKLKIAQERAARTRAISGLEDEARDLSEKLAEQQVKLTNEQSEKDRSIQNADTAQAEMQRLKAEVDAVRKDLKRTLDDRNAKLAQVTELTDRLNQTNNQLAQQTVQAEEMRGQLARAKLVLDRNGLDEYSPIDNQPPALDGVVTMVRDTGFVEVSLGSDEGLRAGHKLDIYRQDGSYLGRVIVVDTNSDRAVARIVPEYRQGIIRRGDRVATKLL